jgi:hypothetical protein
MRCASFYVVGEFEVEHFLHSLKAIPPCVLSIDAWSFFPVFELDPGMVD